MTKASDNLFPGIIIRESANDGSDFSNPAADYRRLFVGEDGLFHLKDSAGNVTTPGGTTVATDAIWDAAGDLVQGTGANTAARLALGTAGQVLKVNSGATAAEWGASAAGDFTNATNPELITTSTGSDIDLSGATLGTGVTTADLGDGLRAFEFTNNSYQHADVSHALGTGNFDLRGRIIAVTALDSSAAPSGNMYGGLYVADSSRTAATRQALAILGKGHNTQNYARPFTNATFIGGALNWPNMPCVIRLARSGTTLTFYISQDEGHSWTILATATTSVDFQKVGFLAHGNTSSGRIVYERVYTI